MTSAALKPTPEALLPVSELLRLQQRAAAKKDEIEFRRLAGVIAQRNATAEFEHAAAEGEEEIRIEKINAKAQALLAQQLRDLEAAIAEENELGANFDNAIVSFAGQMTALLEANKRTRRIVEAILGCSADTPQSGFMTTQAIFLRLVVAGVPVPRIGCDPSAPSVASVVERGTSTLAAEVKAHLARNRKSE